MNKYKKLAANTVIFAIGSFGAKFLSFFLNRIYTGRMVAAEFNTKDIIEMCANLLIPVVSFSITDAIIRYGLDKNYSKRSVFSNAIAALIFGFAAFLLLSPLLLLYADIRHYWFLLIMFVCVSCFRQVSTQFARARGLVRLYAFDGIGCTLSLLFFTIVFIVWLDLGVTGFMLASICSDFCSGMFVWQIAEHKRFFSFRYVDRELLDVMLRFSLPLIPTALLWIITGFSDRIFIKYMVTEEKFGISGASAAGVYGAATKIPNLISMVSTIFYQAWNMSAIAENDSATRHKFYTQIYSAYQGMLCLAAAFIILLVKPLNALVINYQHDPLYRQAFLYTPLLVVAVLLMCMNQFLSSIYTVSKHTKNSFYTSLIAAVANLILNAVLIPRYAVYGAIAATVASYLLCYLIRIFDTRRFISFRIDYIRSASNLVLLFGMCKLLSKPTGQHYFFAFLLLLLVVLMNFAPLLLTAKKILRRKS